MKKIVVFIEGGVIQSIEGSIEDVEMIVVDRDIEGLEEDELSTKEEVEEKLKGCTFKNIKFEYYNNNDILEYITD